MNFEKRMQRSFKPRFAIIYPFALFFVLFGYIDDQSLRAGIGFIIAGLLIRLWSNGYAIKNDKLTISGPYAFVRNPLYLGTFLITVGFVITLNLQWPESLLFLGSLMFMYYQTIKGEQQNLMAKFGENYKAYCAKVPAMVPTLIPYTNGEQWPFSLQRLIVSKEHKTIVWLTVIIILFTLKTRLLILHKPMVPRTWGLVFLAAILIMSDIFYEFTKKK